MAFLVFGTAVPWTQRRVNRAGQPQDHHRAEQGAEEPGWLTGRIPAHLPAEPAGQHRADDAEANGQQAAHARAVGRDQPCQQADHEADQDDVEPALAAEQSAHAHALVDDRRSLAPPIGAKNGGVRHAADARSSAFMPRLSSSRAGRAPRRRPPPRCRWSGRPRWRRGARPAHATRRPSPAYPSGCAGTRWARARWNAAPARR